jgi:hypothetical protein
VLLRLDSGKILSKRVHNDVGGLARLLEQYGESAVEAAKATGERQVAMHMFGPMAARPAQPGEKLVPILAAAGEVVLPRRVGERVGRGDLEANHDALDAWVRVSRRDAIRKLRRLPDPWRDIHRDPQ